MALSISATQQEKPHERCEKVAVMFFFAGVHSFFEVITNYLQKKLRLKDFMAFHFRFLNPWNRKDPNVLESLIHVAERLPSYCEFVEEDTDLLRIEWKFFAMEEIPSDGRIDNYWSSVMSLQKDSGDLKFPIITKLVKACLAAASGNAATERTVNELAHTRPIV